MTLIGTDVRIEPLNTEKHHRSLYQNFLQTPDAFQWVLDSDIETLKEFRLYCLKREQDPEMANFVVSKTDLPGDYLGVNSLAKPVLKHKNIDLELGIYSNKLQGTAASTESYYLLPRYVYGELRFMKANVKDILPRNRRATRTLERLGFTLEVYSSRALVIKNYALDVTCWGMTEPEWQNVKIGLEQQGKADDKTMVPSQKSDDMIGTE